METPSSRSPTSRTSSHSSWHGTPARSTPTSSSTTCVGYERYEDLVGDPEGVLRSICGFAQLPYDPRMLDYTGRVDVSAKPHQQRLKEAPRRGVREWRTEMPADDVAEFEAVAGDLLRSCGYALVSDPRGAARAAAARARFASYRARAVAWRSVARLLQRSPLWRRRHPLLA